MNVITEFRKRILTKDGKKFVRSAQSRLAEELNCGRTTVRNWFIPNIHGEVWTPGREKLEAMRLLLKKNWKPESLNSESRHSKTISAHGKTLTLLGWSKFSGIELGTIKQRIRSGWPMEDAVSKKARRWRKRKS